MSLKVTWQPSLKWNVRSLGILVYFGMGVFVNIVIGGVVAVEVVGVVGVVGVAAVVVDVDVNVGHAESSSAVGGQHTHATVHVFVGETLVNECLYVWRKIHSVMVLFFGAKIRLFFDFHNIFLQNYQKSL